MNLFYFNVCISGSNIVTYSLYAFDTFEYIMSFGDVVHTYTGIR